MMLYSAAVHLL